MGSEQSKNRSMRGQRLGSVAPSEAADDSADSGVAPPLAKEEKQRSWVVAAGAYIGFGGKRVDVNWKDAAPQSAPDEYDHRRTVTPRITMKGQGSQRTRISTVSAEEAKKRRQEVEL